jgi:hypothetical protein
MYEHLYTTALAAAFTDLRYQPQFIFNLSIKYIVPWRCRELIYKALTLSSIEIRTMAL